MFAIAVTNATSAPFLVRLQFVVYDLAKIYTLGGRNESGANANQSFA